MDGRKLNQVSFFKFSFETHLTPNIAAVQNVLGSERVFSLGSQCHTYVVTQARSVSLRIDFFFIFSVYSSRHSPSSYPLTPSFYFSLYPSPCDLYSLFFFVSFSTPFLFLIKPLSSSSFYLPPFSFVDLLFLFRLPSLAIFRLFILLYFFLPTESHG
jgi:hypothetical protein